MKPHEIKGQCVAKRAFEVAAAGDLRVLLVGPLAVGKTTLREAFRNVTACEIETCACGHYSDPKQQCACSERQILRWYRRLERIARDYDIVVEVCAVPVRELMARTGSTERDDECMRARIAAAREFGRSNQSLALTDDAAIRTMEMAARRLGLSAGQYNHVLRTARAIANLDQSPTLKAKHVAEAVRYRADAYLYRLDRIISPAA